MKKMIIEQHVDQIVNDTADTLISAPILHQIDILTRSQLHFLFSQIYYLVESFPGLLAALILQTNDDAIRFAIIDNLVDECGGIEKVRSRDFSATHSQLLKQFIEKLSDKATPAIAEKSAHTNIMLSHFKRLFFNSTLVEVLSALAAMEGASTKWFNLLYKKLLVRNEFTGDDLYFFELHTVMDEEHGDVLKETLLPLLTNDENLALFESGATTAGLISKNFYIGLANEMMK